MPIQFTDYLNAPTAPNPFAAGVQGLFSGAKQAGEMRKTLAQALQAEAMAKYMPQVLENQMGLRDAQAGLAGAHAGNVIQDTGLESMRIRALENILGGKGISGGGAQHPKFNSPEIVESGGGQVSPAVIPPGMNPDDYHGPGDRFGTDQQNQQSKYSPYTYEQALGAHNLLKLGTPQIIEDAEGNKIAKTALGDVLVSKGLSPFDKSRVQALAKVPAEFYKSAIGAYQGFQNQGVALDEIRNAIVNNPEFNNVTGPIGSNVTRWLGTPEQRELLGRLQSASGEIALQVAPALKGAFTGRDQALINSIKASPADFPDVFVGKLQAQTLINNVLKDRSEKIADYIEQGMSPIKASRRAAEETPLDQYRHQVKDLIKGQHSGKVSNQNSNQPTGEQLDFISQYVQPFNRAIGSTGGALATGAVEGIGSGIRNAANLIPGVNLPDFSLQQYLPSNSTSRIFEGAGKLGGEIGLGGKAAQAIGLGTKAIAAPELAKEALKNALAAFAVGGTGVGNRSLGAILGGTLGSASNLRSGKLAKEVVGAEKEATAKYGDLYKDLFQGSEGQEVKVPTINSDLIMKHSSKDFNSALKGFLENPTIENAHAAQSDMGKLAAFLQKKNLNNPLTSSKLDTLKAAQDAQKRLRGVIGQKLEESSPGKFKDYMDITKGYGEEVIPYTRQKDIQLFKDKKISKGQLVSRLIKDEKFMQDVKDAHPYLRNKQQLMKFLSNELVKKGLIGLGAGAAGAAGFTGAREFLK